VQKKIREIYLKKIKILNFSGFLLFLDTEYFADNELQNVHLQAFHVKIQKSKKKKKKKKKNIWNSSSN
jgi:hypothetical protein